MIASNQPRNLNEVFCFRCRSVFPDIWAYKRHQDNADDPCNHPAPPR